MINAVFLAGIADRIASYFSHDALFWPGAALRREPIGIRWVSDDDEPQVRALIDALKLRTAAPYRSEDHESALRIVAARPGSEPAATITFWFDHRPHDGPGVRYELETSGSSDVYPGWFSLDAT